MRPKIAVSGPTHGGGPAWFFTAIQVYLAGGSPIRFHPDMDWKHHAFDALILGGGADITIHRGEDDLSTKEKVDLKTEAKKNPLSFLAALVTLFLRKILSYESSRGRIDPERDVMESELYKKALRMDRPIFAICRGMQLVNVLEGGSLNQDIKGFYTEYPQLRSSFPLKTVGFLKSTYFSRLYSKKMLRVNALHDQSLARLGQNLRVVAREENGIIQAIEGHQTVNGPQLIGVQWHPEFLFYLKDHRRLFSWLVEKAKVNSPDRV